MFYNFTCVSLFVDSRKFQGFVTSFVPYQHMNMTKAGEIFKHKKPTGFCFVS